MNDAQPLEIRIERKDDSVIVQPTGEIDLSCSADLRHELRDVQRSKPKKLIIDLQQVPYMDSSGVATLVEAMQSARREKTSLILCSLQDKVRSMFEIAKLDSVFTITENADIAHSQ